MKKYDAIIVLSGGMDKNGKSLEWTKRRLEKALEVWRGEPLILSSGISAHKAPLTRKGRLIRECDAMAEWLIARDVPRAKILLEGVSSDTIGGAYCTRFLHTEPAGFRKLLVITSVFHAKRARAIFEWIFGIEARPSYRLDFVSVADGGIAESILGPRRRREQRNLRRVRALSKRVRTLRKLHRWFWAAHAAYAAGKTPEKISKKELASY